MRNTLKFGTVVLLSMTILFFAGCSGGGGGDKAAQGGPNGAAGSAAGDLVSGGTVEVPGSGTHDPLGGDDANGDGVADGAGDLVADNDSDGVADNVDNCPDYSNSDQAYPNPTGNGGEKCISNAADAGGPGVTSAPDNSIIYVMQTGVDTNTGIITAPVKTLSKAVAMALADSNIKHINLVAELGVDGLCTGMWKLDNTLEVPAGVSLHGSFCKQSNGTIQKSENAETVISDDIRIGNGLVRLVGGGRDSVVENITFTAVKNTPTLLKINNASTTVQNNKFTGQWTEPYISAQLIGVSANDSSKVTSPIFLYNKITAEGASGVGINVTGMKLGSENGGINKSDVRNNSFSINCARNNICESLTGLSISSPDHSASSMDVTLDSNQIDVGLAAAESLTAYLITPISVVRNPGTAYTKARIVGNKINTAMGNTAQLYKGGSTTFKGIELVDQPGTVASDPSAILIGNNEIHANSGTSETSAISITNFQAPITIMGNVLWAARIGANAKTRGINIVHSDANIYNNTIFGGSSSVKSNNWAIGIDYDGDASDAVDVTNNHIIIENNAIGTFLGYPPVQISNSILRNWVMFRIGIMEENNLSHISILKNNLFSGEDYDIIGNSMFPTGTGMLQCYAMYQGVTDQGVPSTKCYNTNSGNSRINALPDTVASDNYVFSGLVPYAFDNPADPLKLNNNSYLTSHLVDSGLNLSTYPGVETTDYMGTPRPQSGPWDIGAREYVP